MLSDLNAVRNTSGELSSASARLHRWADATPNTEFEYLCTSISKELLSPLSVFYTSDESLGIEKPNMLLRSFLHRIMTCEMKNEDIFQSMGENISGLCNIFACSVYK